LLGNSDLLVYTMASVRRAGALMTLLFAGARAHGYLSKPIARSGNNNGLNGGWDGNWCAGSNGKKAIRATYTGGQVVEFQHVITAHHFGHLEMRICNRTVGDSCPDAYTLMRAEPAADCVPNDSRPDCQPVDVRHPERFYLPPRSAPNPSSFRYIIPADLSCESCTLQWRWWVANSGVGANDYGCYWDQIDAAGWNSNNYHGYFSGHPCGSNQAQNVEQFFGCSDISVLPGGPTPAPTTAAPTPAPPPSPAPPPTTPAPTTTPAPAPNCCKWSSNCGGTCASGWCSQSQSDCSGCGGHWCAPTLLSEVKPHEA